MQLEESLRGVRNGQTVEFAVLGLYYGSVAGSEQSGLGVA